MAYWGIAMTLFQPLWPTRPDAEALRIGFEAVQKAQALAPPTERERMFVAAAEAFFREPAASDYWLRIRRWAEAQERLRVAFPEDDEAAICDKEGITYKEVQVANDGISVVTNPDLKVDCLTTDQLKELWNTFAEAWLPGGPEDPNAVLMRVDVDSGEYWDTPGGKVASLLSFAKTKLTGDTYDADHGRVDV